jgi:hypothetical protein
LFSFIKKLLLLQNLDDICTWVGDIAWQADGHWLAHVHEWHSWTAGNMITSHLILDWLVYYPYLTWLERGKIFRLHFFKFSKVYFCALLFLMHKTVRNCGPKKFSNYNMGVSRNIVFVSRNSIYKNSIPSIIREHTVFNY